MSRQYMRRIDLPAPVEGGGSQLLSAANEQLPAPIVAVARPENLTVIGTGLRNSAVTPTAFANLSWTPGNGTPPRALYEVRQATDSAFTENTRTGTTSRTSASMDGNAGATYYYTVRAVLDGNPSAWSNVVSATLPGDDVAPGPPTSVSASFTNEGALEVRATPPTSANFKHVRVEVWNAAGTVQIDVDQFAGGTWTWSPTRNRQRTAAAGLGTVSTSVQVRLYSVSWGNVYSEVVEVAASSVAPSTPAGLTHSWVADPGTAGADLLITHTVVAGLSYYLAIDGLERLITPGRYVYLFTQNVYEHGGAGDPVITLSLVAENGLGQRSAVPATATATNAPPPSTTLSVFAGFDRVQLTIGASAAADLKDYRLRAYVNGAGTPSDTWYSTELRPVYHAAQGSGSYRFDVSPRDVFGQNGTASALTTAEQLEDQETFIADLRAGATYRDSEGTALATLNGLKDRLLATNVVTYASGTAWKWTEQIRAFAVDHRKGPLSTSASVSVYYGVSKDGVTYTWYSGGTTTGGVWAPVAVADEAAARTAAVTLAGGIWLIQLPATVETRYTRLGHRNTGTAYSLREFYPRSLVEADDIRVENLAAINANMGDIVSGSLTSVTIVGSTIRTNNTTTRVELSGDQLQVINGGVTRVRLDTTGLKTYDSLGNVQVEATTATDGALKAGAGKVTLDRTGMWLTAAASAGDIGSTVAWRSGGTFFAGLNAYNSSGQGRTSLATGDTGGGAGSTVEVSAERTSVNPVVFQLLNTGSARQVAILSGASPVWTYSLTNSAMSLTGSITATGDITGQRHYAVGNTNAYFFEDRLNSANQWAWYASSTAGLWRSGVGDVLTVEPAGNASLAGNLATGGVVGVRLSPSGSFALRVGGVGSSTSTYGIASANSVGSDTFWVRDDGAAWVAARMAVRTTVESSIALVVNGATTGTTQFGLAVRDSGSANNLYIRDDGYVWTRGTIDVGGLNNRSDERFKVQIEEIPDALALVQAIPARRWRWAGDPDGVTHYGPTAQEAEVAAPELVAEGQPGPGEQLRPGHRGVLSVRLGSLVGLHHGALQQLAARVAALEEALSA